MRHRYPLMMVQAGILLSVSCLGNTRVDAQEASSDGRRTASEPSAVQAAPSAEMAASSQTAQVSEGDKEVVEVKSVGMEDGQTIYSMELRHVDLKDLLRLLAHDYHLNIAIDKDVAGEVTASFERVTLREALDTLLSLHGYRIEQRGHIMQVTKNLVTQLFVLNSVEARTLLESGGAGAEAAGAGAAAAGAGAEAAGAGAEAAGAGAAASGGATTGSANTIFDLLSPDGKIFLGQQPNSLMVRDHIENIRAIAEYLGMVDRSMMSKIFKLKYIQASTLLGQTPVESQTTSSGSTTASTSSGTSTSSALSTKTN